MKQKDFFKVLTNKGSLRISGLDSKHNPYRVYGYEGKEFKLTLEEVEEPTKQTCGYCGMDLEGYGLFEIASHFKETHNISILDRDK